MGALEDLKHTIERRNILKSKTTNILRQAYDPDLTIVQNNIISAIEQSDIAKIIIMGGHNNDQFYQISKLLIENS